MPRHIAARRQGHIARSRPERTAAVFCRASQQGALSQRRCDVSSGLYGNVPAAGGADAAQAGVHSITRSPENVSRRAAAAIDVSRNRLDVHIAASFGHNPPTPNSDILSRNDGDAPGGGLDPGVSFQRDSTHARGDPIAIITRFERHRPIAGVLDHRTIVQ